MPRILRVMLTTIALGAALTFLSPATAAALPPGCEASINNSSVENHQTPGSAKEVDADSRAVIRGVDAGGAGQTTVGIQFEPFPSLTVYDEVETGTDWSGEVRVDDYATYGVGLYKVTASSDNCSGFVWIKVTGKSPLTTVAGIISAVLVLTGLATGIPTIVRAQARSRGAGIPVGRIIAASVRSGIPLGLGAMIFAQQSGVFPITGATIVAWLVFASSAIGLSYLVVSSLKTSRAAESPDAAL